MFGVCTVLVDTAGGSANKAVTIPYLTKQQAEWLRAELFARKRGALAGTSSQMAFGQATAPDSPVAARPRAAEGNVLDAGAAVWSEFGGVFGGAELDTGYVSYEYGLSNKELLLAGLSGNTSFFIAIAGVIGAVSQIVPVDRHVSSGGGGHGGVGRCPDGGRVRGELHRHDRACRARGRPRALARVGPRDVHQLRGLQSPSPW